MKKHRNRKVVNKDKIQMMKNSIREHFFDNMIKSNNHVQIHRSPTKVSEIVEINPNRKYELFDNVGLNFIRNQIENQNESQQLKREDYLVAIFYLYIDSLNKFSNLNITLMTRQEQIFLLKKLFTYDDFMTINIINLLINSLFASEMVKSLSLQDLQAITIMLIELNISLEEYKEQVI